MTTALVSVPHSLEGIGIILQAASHDLTDSQEVRDLDWFKENGYQLRPFPTGLVPLSASKKEWHPVRTTLSGTGLRHGASSLIACRNRG